MLPPKIGMHQHVFSPLFRTIIASHRTAALPQMSGPYDAGTDRTRPGTSDLRTFECPKCDHVVRTMVEDPMNSAKAGCLNGELGSER
jgi:hypothetical protein